MFVFDFVLGEMLDQMLDWLYGQLLGFLSNFFVMMGNMGVELFAVPWIQSVVLFFTYLAWSLYVVGIIVAVNSTRQLLHTVVK